MKKIFTIVVLAAMALTAYAQQKKVAVYVDGDKGAKVLASKLTTAILNNCTEYTAVERTAAILAEISKEQAYQHSGAVDDEELSRLGKQFGVQYVCAATMTEVFNEQYISARLIDVESAQVERAVNKSANIQSLDEAQEVASSLANALFAKRDISKQANTKKVAVYVIKNEASKGIGRVMGDKIVEGFTNSGRYVAIERTNSFLSKLNKEQAYQREGAVDDSEISRLGVQFGVRYVCVVDISDEYGEKYIVVRMIDVERAEAINNYDIGGKITTMAECVAMANKITEYLSKGTPQELAEEKARLEAEHEAKIKAQQEAEAERQRLAAEERRRIQEKVDKRKAEYRAMMNRGYAIVQNEKTGIKYMICLKPLDEVTYKDYKDNVRFSKYGYNDWYAISWNDWRRNLRSCKVLDIAWDENDHWRSFDDVLNEIYYLFGEKILFSPSKDYWLENVKATRHVVYWEYLGTRTYVDEKERSYYYIGEKMGNTSAFGVSSKSLSSVILYREIK